MLKIVVLVCAILGIISSVSIETWLRRRVGNKDFAEEVYSATLEKYGDFWFSLLIPIVVLLAIVGVVLGVAVSKTSLIGYAAGAVSCLIALFVGSRTYTSGVVSSASLTAEGDITIEPFTPEQFRQKSWHELSQLESGIVDQQTRYP